MEFAWNETRISTLLYQLNQYLWIEHAQVLQQVESLTANSFAAPSENNLPPFSSLRFTSIEFSRPLFARSSYHLEKGEPPLPLLVFLF